MIDELVKETHITLFVPGVGCFTEHYSGHVPAAKRLTIQNKDLELTSSEFDLDDFTLYLTYIFPSCEDVTERDALVAFLLKDNWYKEEENKT